MRTGEKMNVWMNDEVSVFELSNEALTSLESFNIKSVKDFLSLPEDEEELKALYKGMKKTDEIVWYKAMLKKDISPYSIHDGFSSSYMPYFTMNGKVYENKKISSLSFLPSLIKKLNENSLFYVCDILALSESSLRALGLSQKKVESVLSFQRSYKALCAFYLTKGRQTGTVAFDSMMKGCSNISIFIAKNISMMKVSSTAFRNVLENVSLVEGESYASFLEKVYENEEVFSFSKEIVFSVIEKITDSILVEDKDILYLDLVDALPLYLKKPSYLCKIIDKLREEEKIFFDGMFITKRRCTLNAYLSSLEEGRNKNLLISYLDGKGVSEIEDELKISRQRINDIFNKILSRRCLTEEEERYTSFFEKYHVSEHEFCATFNSSLRVYRFLSRITEHNKGKRLPFAHMLNDSEINNRYKENAKKVIHEGEVLVDGKYVRKCHKDLVTFTLSEYCKEAVSYDYFVEKFNYVTKDLSDEEKKEIGSLSKRYDADLAMKKNVIWVSATHFKYCSLSDEEIASFYDSIDFSLYNNLYISSALIFNQYPNVMKKYLISDPYELHDFLSKTFSSFGPKMKVVFGRNPSIAFGNANLKQQLLVLLDKKGPLTQTDIVNICYKKFGFNKGTVRNSYIPLYLKDCKDDLFYTYNKDEEGRGTYKDKEEEEIADYYASLFEIDESEYIDFKHLA